jgi:hypothetical protein
VSIWWRGRRANTWDHWRFERRFTLAQLRAVRHAITAAWEACGKDSLGFAPRTFAVTVARQNGLELPARLDGILFSYALYQRIQVAEGTYAEGPPGQVVSFANVYDHSNKERQQTLNRKERHGRKTT